MSLDAYIEAFMDEIISEEELFHNLSIKFANGDNSFLTEKLSKINIPNFLKWLKDCISAPDFPPFAIDIPLNADVKNEKAKLKLQFYSLYAEILSLEYNKKEKNETLKCYVSDGMGSCGFAWIEKQPNGKLIANSRRTTMKEAMEYMESPAGKELREKGYIVFPLKNDPIAIKPVYRIDKNILEIDKNFYAYEIQKGWVCDNNLLLMPLAPLEIKQNASHEYITDESIRAAVIFFLNHEKEISAYLCPNNEE